MKCSSPAISKLFLPAFLAAIFACLPCASKAQTAPVVPSREKPLDGLKGPTIEALVTWGLMQSGTPAEEAAALAADMKFRPGKTVTDTVSAINGIPSRSGKFRRTLTVQIISQNVQQTHGFTGETMEVLQKALANGAPVIADLSRKSWRPKDGNLPDETPKEGKTSRAQREETQRVLLASAPNQNVVICRMPDGSRGKTATLSFPELTAAISSYAAVRIAASKEETILESFPKDFRFDATLIKPGHYAYLAVPYQRQGGGSICSAAAALNILHFIDPALNLQQKEVLALYTRSASAGASPPQIVAGIRNLGYEAVMSQPRDTDKITLMAKVWTSLDEGRPMLVTTTKHALTLIGYNKSAGTLIFWDQRMETPGSPPPLPAGAVEANEDSLRARMTNIIFVRKNGDGETPSASEFKELSKIPGNQSYLRHQIVNANPKLAFKTYLRHASVAKISDLHNRGRTVMIPTPNEKTPFLEVTGKMNSEWLITPQPSGKEASLSPNRVSDALETSNGVFYSRPVQ